MPNIEGTTGQTWDPAPAKRENRRALCLKRRRRTAAAKWKVSIKEKWTRSLGAGEKKKEYGAGGLIPWPGR